MNKIIASIFDGDVGRSVFVKNLVVEIAEIEYENWKDEVDVALSIDTLPLSSKEKMWCFKNMCKAIELNA